MRMNRTKRKLINLCLKLIMIGALISIVGFGMVGFNYKKLMNQTITEKWYHTIHINDENLWYGVRLGNDFFMMNIGSPE